jgi:hypothetical protein
LADKKSMSSKRVTSLLLLALTLLPACGTESLSTRAFEENTLAMGEAQKLYRYGHDLLRQGRYREALSAYSSAEQRAYTDDLRQAARVRRMWLEDVIAAHEAGRTPPSPPAVVRDPTLPPYSPDLPSAAPEPRLQDEPPPLPEPSPSSVAPYGSSGSSIRETPLGN